jgi:uncharacterized membrane protein
MMVFFILAAVFGALLLTDRLGLGPTWLRSHRNKLRIALAAMFLVAASGRLVNPDMLVDMLPGTLPLRREAVYLSGFLEVLGAIGLLMPRVRRAAAWGLLVLLVVVFPANVNVAVFNLHIAGYPEAPVYQWARLLLQLGLIWLVWQTTRLDAAEASATPASKARDGRLGALKPQTATPRAKGG